MKFPRSFRLATVALVPIAAISLSFCAALPQSPQSAPPPATPPAASAPAAPAPGPTATPAPPPAETKSPADMPSTAQAPPPAPAHARAADPFGEQITLEPKMVVIAKGNANWASAFDSLNDSFKSLSARLDKQGIQSAGNAMIVYTSTDDTGFTY